MTAGAPTKGRRQNGVHTEDGRFIEAPTQHRSAPCPSQTPPVGRSVGRSLGGMELERGRPPEISQSAASLSLSLSALCVAERSRSSLRPGIASWLKHWFIKKNDWRLIVIATVNRTGSPQGFGTKLNLTEVENNTKHAHVTNVKHINAIRKLVP